MRALQRDVKSQNADPVRGKSMSRLSMVFSNAFCSPEQSCIEMCFESAELNPTVIRITREDTECGFFLESSVGTRTDHGIKQSSAHPVRASALTSFTIPYGNLTTATAQSVHHPLHESCLWFLVLLLRSSLMTLQRSSCCARPGLATGQICAAVLKLSLGASSRGYNIQLPGETTTPFW
jgi:hypothetical protein